MADPRGETIILEQALLNRLDGGTPGLIARSPGFRDDWLPEAERLIQGFGQQPPGVACPLAVFAQPFDKRHVAVVQVAEQPGHGKPSLVFHFLVVPLKFYQQALGDPFAVVDRYPAPWGARSELPTLDMAAEPLPARTVREVQRVLQRVKAHALRENEDPTAREDDDPAIRNAEGPALLGGAQILVDGGKLLIERPAPDAAFIRGLWTLLPTANRAELWPASFAFSTELGFDAVVVPSTNGKPPPGYSSEDQAADYPQGRYELNLQIAAEAGDQEALDQLFARRTSGQTWRLAVGLVVVLSLVVLFIRWIETPPPVPPVVDRSPRAVGAAGVVAVGDPWTALSLVGYGNQLWAKDQKK